MTEASAGRPDRRALDRHLDADELDALVAPPALSVDDSAGGNGMPAAQFLAGAKLHAESCPDCRQKVVMHKSVQDALSGRKPGSRKSGGGRTNNVPPGASCPDDSQWPGVAAGLLPENVTRERMKHAAQCDHCGPLLRAASETLSDETTPDEEQLLSSLSSAAPAWRNKMAEDLKTCAAPADQKRQADKTSSKFSAWFSSLFSWPNPAFAAAAVALAAAASWLGVVALRPPNAEQLLAQAYTERRTLEPRIASAHYAPMRVERGPSGSNLDKPAALLKAESLIAENLKKNPNDPTWLQARARADLLDGNYDSAIKTLQRALETQPDQPSLLTDLGSAYYLRAQSADRPIDYGNAIESLGKALAKSPDDPIALYNQALACEQLFLYTQAIDDWQHYLRLDPQSEWSEEARKRLASVQEVVKKHAERVAEPLLTPEQIADGKDDPAVREKIDERVEDYLNVAITEWLPKAFPPRGAIGHQQEPYEALEALAQITKQKHGDQWLGDVLEDSGETNFPSAVASLSEARKANEIGENVSARQHATEARRQFQKPDSGGALRATVEYMFASQSTEDVAGCLDSANGLEPMLQVRPYPWLKAQFLIEKGDCTWMGGNLGDVKKSLLQAALEAESGHYKAIHLRSQDHLSNLAGTVGDAKSAWAGTRKALELYWSGTYPPVRGFNLYFGLSQFAISAKQPCLNMSVWLDGVTLSDSDKDTVQSAMSHWSLASAAVECDKPELAEKEFTRASELFAASPRIESTRIAQLEDQIELSSVKVSMGKAQQAISLLKQVSTEIAQYPTNHASIRYYTTLGEAESSLGHVSQADSALRVAVALADSRLRSLHDDLSRLQWSHESSNAYRSLVQQQFLSGNPQAALETWEWYRGSGMRRAATESPNPSELPEMKEVSERIPSLSKQTVVAYASLPKGLAVWVYDDRGISSTWIQSNAKSVSVQAERFRDLCSKPDSDIEDIRPSAQALYRILVAPIAPWVTADRLLVIESDDQLATLPFEALIDENGRYLSDRAAIVSSPGLYYRSDARGIVPITAGTAAVIAAVPTSAAALEPPMAALPDALAEGETVAKWFHNSQFMRGSAATTRAVAAALPDATLFHFAGHAMSSSQHAGLLLSDSFLNSTALRRISLPRMQLAVLSACDTQDGSGEGVAASEGLVRTFLSAGVPNVVASRWTVDSSGSREFMDFFYRALLDGKSVADSVRQAQSTLRQQRGTSQPYYWAAFSAFSLN